MGNNFDMEEINRIREERHAELKSRIKLAKERDMHESFIRFLEAYDNYEAEDKNPMIFHEGANEEQIAEYEKELDLKIPEYYRKILKFSNGIDAIEAGVFFYGVNKGDKNSFMSVTNPKEFQDDYNIEIPVEIDISDRLLIIGDTFDPALCINLTNQEISTWDHEFNNVCCYDDFFSFLEMGVIDYIMHKNEE